jgi:hypothetical protein
MDTEIVLLRQIRIGLVSFMVGLVLSGVTAFPLETELQLLHDITSQSLPGSGLTQWITTVYEGVKNSNQKYPFISYGTDWLAFAHLMIAVAFVGPLRDPIKNIWVVEFGLIACICVFPLAFIAGTIRGIPIYWQLIDCSFGFFGGILLGWCYVKMLKLKKLQQIPLLTIQS